MLEFSRQEDCDEDLEDGSLNGDHGDHGHDGMGSVPEFQIPQEFEETDETDDGSKVGNGSHDRSKLIGVVVETWTEEERDQENDNEECHVPNDGSQTDDRDPEQSRLSNSIDGE